MGYFALISLIFMCSAICNTQKVKESTLYPKCAQDPKDFWQQVVKDIYDLYAPSNKLPKPPLKCKRLSPLEDALQGWSYTLQPGNFPNLPRNITAEDYLVVLKRWNQMASAFEDFLFANMDLDRPVLMKDLVPSTILGFVFMMSLYHLCFWAKAISRGFHSF